LQIFTSKPVAEVCQSMKTSYPFYFNNERTNSGIVVDRSKQQSLGHKESIYLRCTTSGQSSTRALSVERRVD
jgi:hypothetical protein